MSDPEAGGPDPSWRRFSAPAETGIAILCVLIALGHIYVAFDPVISEFARNAYHFAGFAFLAAVLKPAIAPMGPSPFWRAVDVVFGLATAAAAVHLVAAENAIYARGVKLQGLDWAAIAICLLAAVELTRRLTGAIIPVLILLSLSYVLVWGRWIGGVFHFPGLSLETVAFRSVYGDDAMFGSIARISSTYVFLFILFGAFLIRSGAGDFVINLARAVAGRMVGGPGIVAVIASGLTGTISGSAIANTASTGVITIPLMKRAGFAPKFAGGVEAAASTGGQLMPPIMGAGAFVMASFTQIPYEKIVAVAALPALLYFLSVAFFIRVEARRLALPPMAADGQTLGSAFRQGGASFVIPICLLIGLLVSGFTPTYAAVFGILSVVASSWLTRTPMGPKAVWEALVSGTRGMVMTAVLLCSVGLVVNVITTAGVGNTFSLMISDWAGGSILVAIILIGLASLVLGMGLPVTAAYIVLATLSAPALAGMISDRFVIDAIANGTLPETAKPILMLANPEAMMQLAQGMTRTEAAALVHALPLEIAAPLRDMVVPPEVALTGLLSAHMIVFWLSQDSNVTPPVALAAFTAAAIAKAPAMGTGFASWKLAKGLYIVPVLFAYTPLLSGDWGEALRVTIPAVFGLYALAGFLQGGLERPIGWPVRLLAGALGLACLWPLGVLWHALAAAGVVALTLLSARGGLRPPSPAPGHGAP
ncbi:TRAP transporter fused permease subunit [Poseidonocella sp. HB161398]|uniref:TRAP transporter permease n=1 Tax=Poseidonocella sp. HB161398 TaxID=2320855 RepID=UPI001109C264|nr:TRAP transporter fused permease subunit [Poseidonocella sp. HB161398]